MRSFECRIIRGRGALEPAADRPFGASESKRLGRRWDSARQIGAAVWAGPVVRVVDNVVLRAGAVEQAARMLGPAAAPFTPSEARLGPGQSTAGVGAAAGLLKRTGATRRMPDDRRTLQARDLVTTADEEFPSVTPVS